MEIKTRLVRESSRLETVSIVGMGGTGKTTLAQKVYDDAYIVHRFDIRAWVTVSQVYNVHEILLSFLHSITKHTDNKLHEKNTEELKELLYKSLKRKRYLIVMDDVWDYKILDELQRSFTNDKNRSRIMLTTRLDQVGLHFPNSYLHRMHFLNEDESLTLFCENVFGENFFPPEFENVGKNMCRNCRGLPLSIVVIAGLLSNSTKTHDEWKKIAENISSVVTSNDEQCSKILYLSYKNLPHHLKGCYLYMGIFPEDFDIQVSVLFKLWIAEGLVKSTGSKTLEDAAEEYLLDLVQRNLVMVGDESSRGKIKTCKIHDLLRNLCRDEARRGNFFHVSSHGIPLDIRHLRRTTIHQGETIGSGRRVSMSIHRVKRPSTSTPLSRSIIYFGLHLDTKLVYFRLLKVLYIHYGMVSLPKEILIELVNLRYIDAFCDEVCCLSSIDKLENLQTIILYSDYKSFQLPQQMWKMQQLRHVQLVSYTTLPCPPKETIKGEISVIVLENLRTLSVVQNFRCTEAVLKRIPNLKKLGIRYSDPPEAPLGWGYYRLNNLARLHKLESLKCNLLEPSRSFLQNITFPTSLRKLTLRGGYLPWKDMTIVGSLPNLQVLKLKENSFQGPEWEPIEGEFLQLKYLLLEDINDLEHWRAENIHFPILKQLVIKGCVRLDKIPFGIGEILTLDSIELYSCSTSVVTSAEEIKNEQLNMGHDFFRLKVAGFNDHVHVRYNRHLYLQVASVAAAAAGCIVL